MCGRYSFAPKKEKVISELPLLDFPDDLKPQYNIAPTLHAPVITAVAPRQVSFFSWGFMPKWGPGPSRPGLTINARSETAATKPMFRDALLKRRCLVLADSFYEWKTGTDSKRHPYRILRKDERILFFAGIWEKQKKSNGDVLDTFCILTTLPNLEMAEIHDRMPVILDTPDKQAQWLHEADSLPDLMVPAPDGLLTLYRVTDRLNKAGVESADFHTPIAVLGDLFGGQ